MDCNICFNQIRNSCLGSCTHHFCYGCLIQWCRHGGLSCPICKTNIREIRFDREFDKLIRKINGQEISNGNETTLLFENTKHIEIINPFGKPIRITLKDNLKGPGVIVQDLYKLGNGYLNGLRKKDIIININKIPIINHKQCIEIVNKCVDTNTNLNFFVLNKEN